MRKFLFGGIDHALTVSISLAAFRIFCGLTLVLNHGIHKLPPSQGFEDLVNQLGFPFPHLFAWLAGLSEFMGGLLLTFGLWTRLSSIFIVITMFVAATIHHGSDPYAEAEKAFLFMAIGLLFLVLGSGRFSLDYTFRRKFGMS